MSSQPAIQPSPEDVVRAYIAALNAHDIDRAQALVAPDCIRHIGWQDTATPDAPGQGVAVRTWRACPDWRYDLRTVVATEELVAVMVRASGTHTGEPFDLAGLGTFPASGRLLHAAWSCVYRVSKGKIVEQWQTIDLLVLLRDLGTLPAG